MKRSYICQIRIKNRPCIQKEFKGIIAIKAFLRSENVSFSDGKLSHLEEGVMELRKGNAEYDVEFLPDCCSGITVNDVQYLPIPIYKKKYKTTKGSLQYAIKKGKLASVYQDGCRYIEDKEIEHR